MPDEAGTPVIAMTGFGRSVDVQQALEAGSCAHVGKPVSVERLARALLEALPAHSARG